MKSNRYLGVVFSAVALAAACVFGAQFEAMAGWTTAQSVEDNAKWDKEARASDDDPGLYAIDKTNAATLGTPLVMKFGAADTGIVAKKLRVKADWWGPFCEKIVIKIEYRDDGGNWVWHALWDAPFTAADNAVYKYIDIPQGKRRIRSVQFQWKYKVSGYWWWLYECQLFEVNGAQIPYGETLEPSSVNTGSAVLQGTVAHDGYDVCQVLFQYGTSAAFAAPAADDPNWIGDFGTSDTRSKFVNGLTAWTKYYYRVVVRNSAGSHAGEVKSFIACPEEGEDGSVWVSPTSCTTGSHSYDDHTYEWQDGGNAFDDWNESSARCYHEIHDPELWSPWLYLNTENGLYNGLRFRASKPDAFTEKIEIQLPDSEEEWKTTYVGGFQHDTFEVKGFELREVSQARVRFKVSQAGVGAYWNLYEFDFRKTGVNLVVDGLPYYKEENPGALLVKSGTALPVEFRFGPGVDLLLEGSVTVAVSGSIKLFTDQGCTTELTKLSYDLSNTDDRTAFAEKLLNRTLYVRGEAVSAAAMDAHVKCSLSHDGAVAEDQVNYTVVVMELMGAARDADGVLTGDEPDFSRDPTRMHPVSSVFLKKIADAGEGEERNALLKILKAQLYKVRLTSPVAVETETVSLKTSYDEKPSVELIRDGEHVFTKLPILLYWGSLSTGAQEYLGEDYLLLRADSDTGSLSKELEAFLRTARTAKGIIRVAVVSSHSSEELDSEAPLPNIPAKSAAYILSSQLNVPYNTTPSGSSIPKLANPFEVSFVLEGAFSPDLKDSFTATITSNVNNVELIDVELQETGRRSRKFENEDGSVRIVFSDDFELTDDADSVTVQVTATDITSTTIDLKLQETGDETKAFDRKRWQVQLTFNASRSEVRAVLSSEDDDSYDKTLTRSVNDENKYLDENDTPVVTITRSSGFRDGQVDDVTIVVNLESQQIASLAFDLMEAEGQDLTYDTRNVKVPDVEDQEEGDAVEHDIEAPSPGESCSTTATALAPQTRIDSGRFRLKVYGDWTNQTYEWQVSCKTPEGTQEKTLTFTKKDGALVSEELLLVELAELGVDPYREEVEANSSGQNIFFVTDGAVRLTAQQVREWIGSKTAEKIKHYFWGNRSRSLNDRTGLIRSAYDGNYDLGNLTPRRVASGGYYPLTPTEVALAKRFQARLLARKGDLLIKKGSDADNEKCAPWDLHESATISKLNVTKLKEHSNGTHLAAIITHGGNSVPGTGGGVPGAAILAEAHGKDNLYLRPSDFFEGGKAAFKYQKLFLGSCFGSAFTSGLKTENVGKDEDKKWKTPIVAVKATTTSSETRALLAFAAGVNANTKRRIAEEFKGTMIGLWVRISSTLPATADIDKITVAEAGYRGTLQLMGLVLTETGPTTNTFKTDITRVDGTTSTFQIEVVSQSTLAGGETLANVKILAPAWGIYSWHPATLVGTQKAAKTVVAHGVLVPADLAGPAVVFRDGCSKTATGSKPSQGYRIKLTSAPTAGYFQKGATYKITGDVSGDCGTGTIQSETNEYTGYFSRSGRRLYCKVTASKIPTNGAKIEVTVAADGTLTVTSKPDYVASVAPVTLRGRSSAAGKYRLNFVYYRGRTFGLFRCDHIEGARTTRMGGRTRHRSYTNPLAVSDTGAKFCWRQSDRIAANGDTAYIAISNVEFNPAVYLSDSAGYYFGYSTVHPSFAAINGDTAQPFADAWYKVFSHTNNVNKVTHAYWDVGYTKYRSLAGAVPQMGATRNGDFGEERF